jgi:AcrR family transcriptional regulator
LEASGVDASDPHSCQNTAVTVVPLTAVVHSSAEFGESQPDSRKNESMGTGARDRSTQGDDRRRAQLLEAAGKVFVRAPSGGLTMAEVAREAGVSKRLMYHYFADLQSLYNELFQGRLGDHVANVDAGLTHVAADQPEQRIATAIRVFLELPATYRQWALMAVLDTLPPELQPQSGPVLDLLVRRWADVETFAGLEPKALRNVMTVTVTTCCLIGTAMDAGDLSIEHATDIAAATVVSLATATRSATASEASRTRK